MLSFALAIAGLIVAAAALFRALSLHRKLTTLSQSYWDLQYEFGRLRARIAKLDGGAADADDSANASS